LFFFQIDGGWADALIADQGSGLAVDWNESGTYPENHGPHQSAQANEDCYEWLSSTGFAVSSAPMSTTTTTLPLQINKTQKILMIPSIR